MTLDEISLKDAVEFVVDNRGKTVPIEQNGIPLIATNCINNDSLYPEFINIRHVSEDIYKNWFRAHPKPDDIILTNKGSQNGAICLVPDPVNFCIAQDMVALRAKKGVIYPRYLFAALRSKLVQTRIKDLNVDSVIPHFKKTDFDKLFLPKPSYPHQILIGDLYFNFCQKIHLNTQTNQTLESIAQAIFKSWFVDFEPVKAKMAVFAEGGTREQAELAAMGAISGKSEAELAQLQQQNPEHYQQLAETAELFPSAMVESELGEIPEGWEVKKIKESASIIKGKSYKSTELQESKTALVTLKSFTRGGGYRLDGLKGYIGTYKKEQEVFAGDLVIAYTDVTQAADVIGKPALVISDPLYDHLVISLDVAVIRPTQDIHKFFFYGLANTEKFQQHTHAHSTGTTVLHLSASAIPDFEYTHPTENLLKQFSEMTKSIFQKKDSLIAENRSLESLRDSLLPKLLSGEIDLSDIQSEVA